DHLPDSTKVGAVDRAGADADLEAVVRGGIVAGGDHHAAVHLPMAHGEVEERRGTHSDVGYLEARLEETLQHARVNALRMQPRVAAKRDPLLAGAPLETSDRAAEQMAVLVSEIAVGDAADVVLADDFRVQRRHPGSAPRFWRPESTQ